MRSNLGFCLTFHLIISELDINIPSIILISRLPFIRLNGTHWIKLRRKKLRVDKVLGVGAHSSEVNKKGGNEISPITLRTVYHLPFPPPPPPSSKYIKRGHCI